jgi:hypothetical protein
MLNKRNNQKILIIGNGRWANEIIKEILKNITVSKQLFIFGNNKRVRNIVAKYKIYQINNLCKLKKTFFSHIIICNKTVDHFKYFNIIKDLNAKILIEKPLTTTDKENFQIYKFSKIHKNKFFLSSQFFFSEFFSNVKNQLKKNKYKINNFKIIWHDKKNEMINGLKKNQNYKVDYLVDVFYHFFSIFNLLLKPKKIIFSKIIKKRRGEYTFKINNIKIDLNISRKSEKRNRAIELKDKNDNLVKINFNKYSSLKMNDKSTKLSKLDKCLSKQLEFFLNSKSVDKSHYSLVENKEDLFLMIRKIKLIK